MRTFPYATTALCLSSILTVEAFHITTPPAVGRTRLTTTSTIRTSSTYLQTIVSPFDESNTDSNSASKATATTTTSPPKKKDDGPLDLTWENVELVLDEMRPFLIQDGGNVAITEIDGPVVRLELQVCVYVCVCVAWVFSFMFIF